MSKANPDPSVQCGTVEVVSQETLVEHVLCLHHFYYDLN